MAYLFTIFNSLQGMFIFIFHCVLQKKASGQFLLVTDPPPWPESELRPAVRSEHCSGFSGVLS